MALQRVVITLKDIDWEHIVSNISLVPRVKKRRQLKINDMPDVFSYKDSRLAEHKLLYNAYNLKTGKELACSNIKCWHCDHNINGEYRGGVVKKKGTTYFTEGYFCDWSCMKKGIKTIPNISIPLCAELYYNQTGNEWRSLKEAPDWELLLEYGGIMGYTEWKNLKGSVDTIVTRIQGLQISSLARLWEMNGG